MSEQRRKPYSTPTLICYSDMRTITLGGSPHPGESPGERSLTDFVEEGVFEEQRSRSTNSGDSTGRSGR